MQDRKFFNSMAVAFAMMAGLASCSNEELNNRLPEGPLPIKLVSSVGTRAIDQSIQNTQIVSGVSVGVFVEGVDASGYTGYTNESAVANGNGGLTAQNSMTFPEDGGSVNIYAYAPYQNGATTTTTFNFTVPTDQSTDDGYCSADLMIGAPTSNPVASTTENVPLIFKHMLTKLDLNFDTNGTNVDLSNAKVSVIVKNYTATVNITGKSITANTSTDNLEIQAADFTGQSLTTYTASVIFVPQTIAADQVLVKVDLGDASTVYEAKLDNQVEFVGGKKYTYTVKLQTGQGGGIEAVLIPIGTSVDDWEEGNLKLQAGIGDYVTKEGNFVKYAEAGDYSNAGDPIVAVIFSTTVSPNDNEEGYNAYAMRLSHAGNKKWMQDNTVIAGSISDFSSALNDLDGLSKTEAVINSQVYQNCDIKGDTYFEFCTREENMSPVGSVGSNWFVPSIGQIIQILNNLGEAGINSQTPVSGDNTSSPIYYVAETAVIDNINNYVTKGGGTPFLKTDSPAIYATVTEWSSNVWCLQTKPTVSNQSGDFKWGFGKNCSKVSSYSRNFIPCVAIKIPTSSASTLQ